MLNVYHKYKDPDILPSFKSFDTSKVTVIRNSKEHEITVEELVRGDVVIVKKGDTIPADIRVFKAKNTTVINSILTGDPSPVYIGIQPGDKGLLSPLKASNMLFYSTTCKEGECTGIVVNSANNTLTGKISNLAAYSEPIDTALNKDYRAFVKLMFIISIILSTVFLLLGYIIGYTALINVLNAAGMILANAPLGISYSIIVILKIFSGRFLKRKLNVKNYHAMEALGSITCICTDKKDILTDDKLSIAYFWYDMEYKSLHKNKDDLKINVDKAEFSLSRYHPKDKSSEKIKLSSVCSAVGDVYDDSYITDDYVEFYERKKKIVEINKNTMTKDELLVEIKKLEDELLPKYKEFYKEYFEKNKTNADKIDSGVLRFFNLFDDTNVFRDKFSEIKLNLPNCQKLGFSVKIIQISENNTTRICVLLKGLPEKIIDKCNKFILKGKEYPISKKFKEHYFLANKYFLLNGKKVVAYAYLDLDPDIYTENYNFNAWTESTGNSEKLNANFPLKNFVFTTLIAFDNPPK
jgi:magnesium-transporting ATPase (P-type)